MSDKRSVSTDALETLGTLIDETQKRDAIHLAVEPVVAGEELRAGDHITVKAGVAYASDPTDGLGIVDPFLQQHVKRGERFWFVMYPRQVKSLRHVWSHPEFPDEPVISPAPKIPEDAKSHSERWLRRYAADLNVGYNDLIDGAVGWVEQGEHFSRGGLLEGVSTSVDFWIHFEIVTGARVPQEKRADFFSCSC